MSVDDELVGLFRDTMKEAFRDLGTKAAALATRYALVTALYESALLLRDGGDPEEIARSFDGRFAIERAARLAPVSGRAS